VTGKLRFKAGKRKESAEAYGRAARAYRQFLARWPNHRLAREIRRVQRACEAVTPSSNEAVFATAKMARVGDLRQRRRLRPRARRAFEGGLGFVIVYPANRAALRRHAGGALGRCQLDAWHPRTGRPASLELTLDVSPAGRVVSVGVDPVDPGGWDPSFTACLSRAARRWRFPPPEEGSAELRVLIVRP
jgi:hypothetical protein